MLHVAMAAGQRGEDLRCVQSVQLACSACGHHWQGMNQWATGGQTLSNMCVKVQIVCVCVCM